MPTLLGWLSLCGPIAIAVVAIGSQNLFPGAVAFTIAMAFAIVAIIESAIRRRSIVVPLIALGANVVTIGAIAVVILIQIERHGGPR